MVGTLIIIVHTQKSGISTFLLICYFIIRAVRPFMYTNNYTQQDMYTNMIRSRFVITIICM